MQVCPGDKSNLGGALKVQDGVHYSSQVGSGKGLLFFYYQSEPPLSCVLVDLLSLCNLTGSGPVGNVDGLSGSVQESANVVLIVGTLSFIILAWFTL